MVNHKLTFVLMVLSIVCVVVVDGRSAATAAPLVVSPDNPRYFMDPSTGRAVYMTGSHTWQNFQDLNHDPNGNLFDYTAYLNKLASNNHNFIRFWSYESIASGNQTPALPVPFNRPGPGNALDGKEKYDLNVADYPAVDNFNTAYFDRLRARTIEARDAGFYVSVMMFQGWSHEKQSAHLNAPLWFANPLNDANNINGIDGDVNNDGFGHEIHELGNSAVTAIQEAYVKRVIDSVNDLDNVIYEIGNELTGESKDFQYRMINLIKQV